MSAEEIRKLINIIESTSSENIIKEYPEDDDIDIDRDEDEEQDFNYDAADDFDDDYSSDAGEAVEGLSDGDHDFEPGYWAGTGRYSKEYDELWDKLVPDSGPAETTHGEILRAISRIYYDRYNNGFGNGHNDDLSTIKHNKNLIAPYMDDPHALDEFINEYSDIDAGADRSVGTRGWVADPAMEAVVDGVMSYVISVEQG